MSLQDNLDKLMAGNNDIGAKLAQKIKNINDALEAKEINAEEAKDLLNDIDVAKHLVELANDLETKILVQQAVDALISIIGHFI